MIVVPMIMAQDRLTVIRPWLKPSAIGRGRLQPVRSGTGFRESPYSLNTVIASNGVSVWDHSVLRTARLWPGTPLHDADWSLTTSQQAGSGRPRRTLADRYAGLVAAAVASFPRSAQSLVLYLAWQNTSMMKAQGPRMTLPTQLVLRALLADPGQEMYGCRSAQRPAAQRHDPPDPGPSGKPGLARVPLGRHHRRARGGPARRRYYQLTKDGAELARTALARATTPVSTVPGLRPRAAGGLA